MSLREFLSSPVTFLAPDKALDGLARCTGNAAPMVTSAAAGWPAVTPGSWPEIRSRFCERLEQLASLSDNDVSKAVEPPIDFPPLATYTIGDALVHVATHNAHHLGQVILLRQLTGAWPPPARGWTW